MADIIFSEDEKQKIITKDSFIIYKDRIPDDVLEALEEGDISLTDLGQIFLALICDQTGQDVPKIDNRYARSIFKNIKKGYDQANRKWLAQCERNKTNGERGGRPKNPDKPSGINENPEEPTGFLNKPSGFSDKPSGFLNNPEEPTETQTNPHEPDKIREEKGGEEKESKDIDRGSCETLPTLEELKAFLRTNGINSDYTVSIHKTLIRMNGRYTDGITTWKEHVLKTFKGNR